jgi:hypothetical protein
METQKLHLGGSKDVRESNSTHETLSSSNISSIFNKVCKKVISKKRDIFYGLQFLGGAGLAVSGYLNGNLGRGVTGALNSLRNSVWFPLSRTIPKKTADTAGSTLAVISNVPQLMGSVSSPELIASSLAVCAYSLRCIPHILGHALITDSSLPYPKKMGKLSLLIKEYKKRELSLGKHFSNCSNIVLFKIPAALLLARGIMQMVDGSVRDDTASISAGAAFTLGAGALFCSKGNNSSKTLPHPHKRAPKPS